MQSALEAHRLLPNLATGVQVLLVSISFDAITSKLVWDRVRVNSILKANATPATRAYSVLSVNQGMLGTANSSVPSVQNNG